MNQKIALTVKMTMTLQTLFKPEEDSYEPIAIGNAF